MATIYLIRHGQASFGADNYDQLSKLGMRQASLLGDFFRDNNIHLDAAYSGDLERQKLTAKLALKPQTEPVKHHIDARFNELKNDEQFKKFLPHLLNTHPDLAARAKDGLKNSKDFQKAIEAVFNHWVSPDCDATGIQSWHDFSTNATTALREMMAREGSGKTIGIFTSGGTIATLVAHTLNLSGSQTYQFYEPVINCSLTRLFYSGDKLTLSTFNDHTYLTALGEDMVTYR